MEEKSAFLSSRFGCVYVCVTPPPPPPIGPRFRLNRFEVAFTRIWDTVLQHTNLPSIGRENAEFCVSVRFTYWGRVLRRETVFSEEWEGSSRRPRLDCTWYWKWHCGSRLGKWRFIPPPPPPPPPAGRGKAAGWLRAGGRRHADLDLNAVDNAGYVNVKATIVLLQSDRILWVRCCRLADQWSVCMCSNGSYFVNITSGLLIGSSGQRTFSLSATSYGRIACVSSKESERPNDSPEYLAKTSKCEFFHFNSFSEHQQSVFQNTTFRPGCPSHFQVCNRVNFSMYLNNAYVLECPKFMLTTLSFLYVEQLIIHCNLSIFFLSGDPLHRV